MMGLKKDEIEILIWDEEEIPNIAADQIILWRLYSPSLNPANTLSVPEELERSAEKIRSRYLSWIYELGEMEITGKKIIDHLELFPGLSFWWMSSVAQKFNASKTSNIGEILKLLVLEEMLISRQPSSIRIHSKNENLATVISDLCKSLEINCRVVGVKKYNLPKQPIYTLLPSLCQAFIYILWYIIKVFPWRLRVKKEKANENAELTFIDVFAHLDAFSLGRKKFASGYWSILVDKLEEWGIKANWAHLFYRDVNTPNLKVANQHIKIFNEKNSQHQSHFLIENNLNVGILLKSIKYYFELRRVYKKIAGIRALKPSASNLDMWKLHQDEWRDSLCGVGAIKNSLYIFTLQNFFSKLPKQKIGVYIMENQPWEMALIHSWKSSGHGLLIGAPHTVIRFWDLRYFQDPKTYSAKGAGKFPAPDIVAVNGPKNYKIIKNNNYPNHVVRQVEALRFLHLSAMRNIYKNDKNNSIKVLVCGDLMESSTNKMLNWISEITVKHPNKVEFIFKPHPAYFFDSRKYVIPNLTFTMRPLRELLLDCGLVFAASSTSAALEAFILGLPVIQMLDGGTVNFSPLRDSANIEYARDSDHLYSAIVKYRKVELSENIADEFFNLDLDIPKWRSLLNS